VVLAASSVTAHFATLEGDVIVWLDDPQLLVATAPASMAIDSQIRRCEEILKPFMKPAVLPLSALASGVHCFQYRGHVDLILRIRGLRAKRTSSVQRARRGLRNPLQCAGRDAAD
jgi:hypothetical protein